MNTQMKPCYECKDTLDEGLLMKCELCEEFVCRDCIQWCNEGIDAGLDKGSWDDDICGDEGEILHAGCDSDILEVCDSHLPKSYPFRGGKRCEQTFCWNHSEVQGGWSCSYCDSSRCGNCFFFCTSCGSPSCVSCGGYCPSCEADYCVDHIRKCQDSHCPRMFCARCSDDKNNMQFCETCDGYLCIDHGEHECSVK